MQWVLLLEAVSYVSWCCPQWLPLCLLRRRVWHLAPWGVSHTKPCCLNSKCSETNPGVLQRTKGKQTLDSGLLSAGVCLFSLCFITIRPRMVPGVFKRLDFPHDGLKLSFWVVFFFCYEPPALRLWSWNRFPDISRPIFQRFGKIPFFCVWLAWSEPQ